MHKGQMIRIAGASMPNLVINEVQFIDSGWDNDLLVINGQIAFRFPKKEELLDQFNDELIILQQLALKKPVLQIPRYRSVYENGILRGVSYPLLKGESLSQCLKDFQESNENAELIADFLIKLHSIQLSALQETHLHTLHTIDYWQKLYASLKGEVFPLIDRELQQQIARIFTAFLAKFPTESIKKVLIHGDLTASNLLYDKDLHRLTGVIDFTDAQIGDPAFDFAGLYWQFGPAFTKQVLTNYATQESKEALFSRVQTFYGLQPVFHELLHTVRSKESVHRELLQRFSKLSAFNTR